MSCDEATSKVDAVVVDHAAGPALATCIASINRAGANTVVVVDNLPKGSSTKSLYGSKTKVEVLWPGENLGYGSAVNAGSMLVHGEYLLVSNPDIVLDPCALKVMSRVLDADPDVAVVGPRLSYPDGGFYPSARAFPSLVTAGAHAFLGLFWPGNPWSRRYRLEQDDVVVGSGPGEERDVDWVSGACFLVRRSAFDSVGGFDEGYFMYVEDLDLCWRLGRAGWRVRFVPAAAAIHEQGLSANRNPFKMIAAHHRSTWRFARRTASGFELLALPAVAMALGVRMVLAFGQEAITRGAHYGSVPSIDSRSHV